MLLYNNLEPPDADSRIIEPSTLALNIIQDSTAGAGDSMVEVSLSSLLFGEHPWHLVLRPPFSQKYRHFDGAIPHAHIPSCVNPIQGSPGDDADMFPEEAVKGPSPTPTPKCSSSAPCFFTCLRGHTSRHSCGTCHGGKHTISYWGRQTVDSLRRMMDTGRWQYTRRQCENRPGWW